MAKRYSGDVELRIEYGNDGFYYAAIRSPGERGRAILSAKEVGLTRKYYFGGKMNTPDAFDSAAIAFLQLTEKRNRALPIEFDEKGKIIIRRTFQAPCPRWTDS